MDFPRRLRLPDERELMETGEDTSGSPQVLSNSCQQRLVKNWRAGHERLDPPLQNVTKYPREVTIFCVNSGQHDIAC
jgi:hypothetical protein